MRIRNQFASHNLRTPTNHNNQTISKLTETGLVTSLCEHGFPFTTAMGNLLLTGVETVLLTQASLVDIDRVHLPTAMRTDTLEKGQKLGDQFRAKIMHLQGSLKNHHVISTPETLFVQLGKMDQMSHSQLPIRQAYFDNLHRQKNNGKGALFPQQIKVFGGVTVVKSEHVDEEIDLLRSVIEKSFDEMRLPYHKEDDYNNFNHEYFYVCASKNEGENLALPGIDKTNRVKAYSMGMIYEYPMVPEFRLRYRSEDNKNKKPSLVSYGFSTPRILHCALDAHRDDKGFNLPASIRPFEVCIIPEKGSSSKAEELYSKMRQAFVKASGNNLTSASKVCLDDRENLTVLERLSFSSYISTPLAVIISQSGSRIIDRDDNTLYDGLSCGEAVERVLKYRI